MEVLNAATQEVKLTPVHGTARILADSMVVEESDGNRVTVPESALQSILPSDGTPILKNADHYAIVRMANM